MSQIDRLQSYLRRSARRQYESLGVAPFTIFINPRDALPFFNCAIPDTPVGGDLGESLAALRTAFMSRDRLPRFEFLESFAPDLAPALAAAGFVEESRTQLMTCTRDSCRPAPAVEGLTIHAIDAESPAELIAAYLTTQRRGFDPAGDPATPAEVDRFRASFGASGAALAVIDSTPATAGMFSAPDDGITELAGIATLESFRRRGIGTALTAWLADAAFARGVELAMLTAADARAGRIYERVGFRPRGWALAYRDR